MKVYFCIAERSLSYAKIVKKMICDSEFLYFNILVSDKTFLELSVLDKIDLNL